MGISSHRLPSGGGGVSEASTVWRQVATGDRWLTAHGEHWDRALMLSPAGPLARPLVPAIPGNVSHHHEEEEISVLIGDDGMYYSTEYPRQDSNLRPQL